MDKAHPPRRDKRGRFKAKPKRDKLGRFKSVPKRRPKRAKVSVGASSRKRPGVVRVSGQRKGRSVVLSHGVTARAPRRVRGLPEAAANRLAYSEDDFARVFKTRPPLTKKERRRIQKPLEELRERKIDRDEFFDLMEGIDVNPYDALAYYEGDGP